MSANQEIFSQLRRLYEYEKQKGEPAIALFAALDDLEAVDSRGADDTLIHYAATYGDVEGLKYLLDHGVKAMVFDRFGATGLHRIAKPSRVVHISESEITTITELLLDHKVSAMRKNSSGETAYHLGVSSLNAAFLKTLIDHDVRITMSDNQGNTVLHLLAKAAVQQENTRKYATGEKALSDLAASDRVIEEMAETLMSLDLDYESRNKDNLCAYELAAKGNAGKVSLILSNSYDETDDTLDLKLQAGNKQLHAAIREGDFQAVKALIALGADVNEVYLEVPFLYQTPLAVALMALDLESTAELLNHGADVNYRVGESERTAFYWMIKYARYSPELHRERRVEAMMTLLLEAGLDLSAPVDEFGYNCIGCAYTFKAAGSTQYAFGTLEDVVVASALEHGADVNQTSITGTTPLMEFVTNLTSANENALLCLLEAGAKLDCKDNRSETVLMKAARHRNESLMVQTVSLMADFGSLAIDTQNNEGKTALDLAIEANHEELSKWILMNS